jgi:hypothetical protein
MQLEQMHHSCCTSIICTLCEDCYNAALQKWHLIVVFVTVIYTGCPRRKGPNFGRVFLRSNYTVITQNTYIQSSMVTEILAREV